MTKTDEPPSGPLKYGVGNLWAIFVRSLSIVLGMETSLRCAGVAFFTFLSIFPAMAAMVAVAGLVIDPAQLDLDVPGLTAALPAEGLSLLNQQLERYLSQERSWGLGLGVSLIVALWTGTRGMNALNFAITSAHQERDSRGLICSTLMSILFTIGAFFTLALLLIATTLVPLLVQVFSLDGLVPNFALLLRWPMLFLVLLLAVFLLLRFAPYRRTPKARWVMPGVLISTTLWLLVSWGLSIYVGNFGSYDVTFGSIAAAAILMLWLFFSALVLVLGACVNAQLEWHTRKDTTVGPDRPMGKRQARVADTLPDTPAVEVRGADA